MKKHVRNAGRAANFLSISILLAVITMFQACDKEDPKPVHEAELITTVQVTLVPEGNGIPVTLKFVDADGEQGSIAPITTVSGSLKPSTSYSAVIELKNETVNPVADITEEVAEEAEDHLFCFDASGDISVAYVEEDEDANGLPLGLLTTWTTGSAGNATVTLSLRHQPGTKTGECPGSGETDVEVTFDLVINE